MRKHVVITGSGLLALALVVPVGCSGSTESRRDSSSTGGGAGTDTNGPLTCAEADGCLSGLIDSGDLSPYDPTNPNRDGAGTFYVTLLDTCPDVDATTYSPLSEAVAVEVDLTDMASTEFELPFDFSASAAEGGSATLVGFLDDDGSSEGSTVPMPNIGDTITNCIDVTLSPGVTGLVMPLAPCLFFTSAAEVYVFDQGGLADCSVYDVYATGAGGAGP